MWPLQEKFQVISGKPKIEEDQWASFESARRPSVGVPEDPVPMPKGMDVQNQSNLALGPMPKSVAGATDVTNSVNDGALREGFLSLPMQGSDDCYTGEHVDHFYGDAGGFAERNNYLDRL